MKPRTDIDRILSLALWLWVTMLTLAAIANFCASKGHTQPNVSELVLAVFRVSINEGALQNVRETSLIWQVIRGHGGNARDRRIWLGRHSKCASGAASCTAPIGNAGWAHRLSPSCEKPEGLDAPEEWWNKARKSRCLAVYELAQSLVEGRVTDEPCEPLPSGKRDPDSWAAVSIHASRLRLGYRQHVCHGVLNEGWSW